MTIANQVANCWPIDRWRDCHVLVAVSGGADSVALLRVLHEMQQNSPALGKLVIGHFNHQVRGQQADADEAWVRQIAGNLGLEVVAGRPDSPKPLDTEELARDARYDFLRTAAEQLGARFVATAHTADDQVETVLMRMLRGSGVDGLAGIPFARPLSPSVTLVRPLLEVRRTEIEAYLSQLGQDYRIDATNFESQFTRNWIRHDLLPIIRERLEGDPDRAIQRLSQQAGEWRAALEHIAGELATAAVALSPESSPTEIVLDRQVLAEEPAIVVQQVCRLAWKMAKWSEQAMGMTDWRRLASAVAGPDTQPFTLPGRVEVRPQSTTVVLARR